MDRREFLTTTSGAMVGLTVSSFIGCTPDDRRIPLDETSDAFPLLEASGSSYEIGLAIGRRFEEQIREGLRRRAKWFEGLRSFALEDPASRIEPFVSAAREEFPEIVEELRGWSEGSGVPFDDLMILNLKAEIATLKRADQPETPGCSTLALVHEGRCLLAHNEDGHRANRGLMFLVRVSRPDRPDFLCLTYPGILCGNGPAVNEAGVVMTTNYIGGLDVQLGVPRYVISRKVLDAGSLDEAVETVSHPRRAFSFHYNLGSYSERRILSVETSVDSVATREVEGLYVHTNHLRLPGMEEVPQDEKYVSTSSMSRFGVLTGACAELSDRLSEVDGDTLVRMLSSHESAPYSPCRHPTDDVTGATLGSALFDMGGGGLRVARGNTCEGSFHEMELPG